MSAVGVVVVLVVTFLLACAVLTVVLAVKMVRSGRARDRALAAYRSAVHGAIDRR